MGPMDILNHVLNFTAPALWLAVVITLAARLFIRKVPLAPAIWAQAAINFIASAITLGIGLWFFGHDGKMLTYLAMTLVCATVQWLMLRGWRH
jgi:hypothetical protein